MNIPNPRIAVPMLILAEYSSMPNRNKGKPTRISIKEKISENALGSVIKIRLFCTSPLAIVQVRTAPGSIEQTQN